MRENQQKDMKPLDEMDEPWLFNYTPPEGWLDSNFFPTPSLASISTLFHPNMDYVFPFVYNPPPTGILQGITGLYNYKVPTDLQFAQCNKVNGLSLWDRNGWWQCLFPQEVIRERFQQFYKEADKIDMTKFVSKESVDNNNPTNLGHYFNDYTKYLVWKMDQQKDEDLLQKQVGKEGKSSSGWLPVSEKVTTPEDMMQWDLNSNENDDKKRIIGKSQYMLYNGMASNGEKSKKEIITTKTFYDDGSCLVKEREKIIPTDSEKPIINEREKVVKEAPFSSSSSSSSSSFF